MLVFYTKLLFKYKHVKGFQHNVHVNTPKKLCIKHELFKFNLAIVHIFTAFFV